MRKTRQTKSKCASSKRDTLFKHNDLGYLDDLKQITKLGFITDSKRDWIETNMLRLRETAPKSEILFSSYLIKNGIKFIHQAPFIFSDKIYFADFYLPTFKTIIEIDGESHNSMRQSLYDNFRDECFVRNGIKVIRIPNEATRRESDLSCFVPSKRVNTKRKNIKVDEVDTKKLLKSKLTHNLRDMVRFKKVITVDGVEVHPFSFIKSKKVVIELDESDGASSEEREEFLKKKNLIESAGYEVIVLKEEDVRKSSFISQLSKDIKNRVNPRKITK